MNWPLAIAGGLALVAAAIHGIVGDRFLRDVSPDLLPANVFGGPATSKTLVRVSWHFVTITFAASGLALLWVGIDAATRFAPGVTALLGVLYTCFGLFALAVGIAQARRRLLLKHPAPLALNAIAALIWWGLAGV